MNMCNAVAAGSLSMLGVMENGPCHNSPGYHCESRSEDPGQPGRATISREKETKGFSRASLHPLPLSSSYTISGPNLVTKWGTWAILATFGIRLGFRSRRDLGE